MKRLMMVRLGLAMAGALLAGTALAQEPGGGPGFGEHRPPMEQALGPRGDHGRWWNNPAIVEKLKLTEPQRKAMDDILLQHREKLVDLRGNLEKAELAMEPLMRDDQPNETKILAQIDKVAQARAELEKANARFLLAIRGKLTPEQWKRMVADRASHGEGHRDAGPGGPKPGKKGQRHLPPPFPPPPAPQGMGPEGAIPPNEGPQNEVGQDSAPDAGTAESAAPEAEVRH
jgi:Spy/CpxP family protein refolding chaperone